ncbi:hypothetical protein [Streptomyces vinaceus]
MSITLKQGDTYNLTTRTVERALTAHERAVKDLRANSLDALRVIFRKGF